MPALKRLQWSVDIAAPASKVYQVLVGPESYKQWTSAFGDGLYFEGSWQKGQRIRFLTPQGHGVTSEIAEIRPNEFISIRHLGDIADNGVEDTNSEAIRAWAPAAARRQGPETISDREEGITVPTALAAFDERQAACECASDLAKARKDSIVLMRHQECSKSAEAA